MRSANGPWLLVGVLALAGCQPLEVEYRRLETRRGDGVVTLRGEPLNGAAVRYDDLGSLVERATYRAGLRDGLVERWYSDGTPGFRATYRGGLRHGAAETWWEDGTPRSASHYVDGVAHGPQREWYRSGALFKEVRLVNGREEGLQRAWRENGELYANYEARDGRTYGMRRSKPCFELTLEDMGAAAGRADAGIERPAPAPDAPSTGAWEGADRTLPYFADANFTPQWYDSHADLPAGFHSIGPFNLIDQTGAPVTDATLRGKIYVANFFFTACPGICPMTMAGMARLQSELGRFDDVALLSHSVTPEADSVPVLQAYAERMRVVSPIWHLVTGRPEVIADLGRRAYFADEDLGRTADDGFDDAFLHTEQFLLVDRDGHIRGVYNGMNRTAMERLIGDVEALRRETG